MNYTPGIFKTGLGKNKIIISLMLSSMLFCSYVHDASANQTDLVDNAPMENIKSVDLDKFMKKRNVFALLVSIDGVTKLEKYNVEAIEKFECEKDCKNCDKPIDPKTYEFGLASMAKSVTSTILGILISKTDKPSLDDTIGKIYPNTKLEDGGFSCRTIKELLLMKGGIQWDRDTNKAKEVKMRKKVTKLKTTTYQAFLQDELENEKCLVGKNKYQYQAIDSIMFGLVAEKYLKEQRGIKSIPEAYIDWLWTQEGMTGTMRWKGEDTWKWRPETTDYPDSIWDWKITGSGSAPKGMITADCCMYSTAEDMIKFGEFILRNYNAKANSDSTPIRDWLHASAQNAIPTLTFNLGVDFELPNCGIPLVYKHYGYQWWHFKDKNNDYDEMGFSAIGRGGQFIRIIPKYNAVIVQFSSRENSLDRIQCKSFRVHKKILRELIKN